MTIIFRMGFTETVPGARLSIKLLSYRYMNSYDKDKMVLGPSYLYNGNNHI